MAEITLQLIQELRQRTGAGLMSCKKALNETSGDIEKAIELLRKKGAAIAEKRAGNVAAQGLVHSYIHAGSQVGVLLEINCETDFVARTEDIKKFAHDICMHIAALTPRCVRPEELDQEFINKEKAIFREQLQSEGKPEKILEKILEGKVEKLYAQVCLLKQPFIKNDKLTVEEMVQELIARLGEKIVIRRFARYEVGQVS